MAAADAFDLDIAMGAENVLIRGALNVMHHTLS